MKDWRQAVVVPDMNIIDALATLDRTAQQIALVVDDSYRLIGTVTDGDIRRALLKGIRLDDTVDKIMQKDFAYARAGDSQEKALAIMRNKLLHQLPVLDSGMHLVGLYTIDKILAGGQCTNPVIIMAGGEGKRLQPLTESCPKPMLQVGGKPILETILNTFIDQGFNHFFLSVNYKADMIKDYFGDGAQWGVEIGYLKESLPLGTAGALAMIPESVDEPVIVINGDILTKVDYRRLLEFHQNHESSATMCVRAYQDIIPYGVVNVSDQLIVGIEEKPIRKCYVNAGLYVLSADARICIPPDTFVNMPDLFTRLIGMGKKVTAYSIEDYWIDIGRMNDYEKANGDFGSFFG